MAHDPNSRAPGAIERRIADLAGRRLVWIVLITIACALPLAKALTTKLPAAPAKIRALPEFMLTSQEGLPFGTEQLRGKLWVANFIFTSCSSVCPQLTHAMARVKARCKNMKGAVHFISFTVDPERDTPAKLDAYAAKNRARGDWTFLTGSLADVRSIVMHGFKLGFGSHNVEAGKHQDSTLDQDVHDPAAELLDAAHGQQLVLVDKDLCVRGYYNPDTDGMDRLVFEMGLIANVEGVDITPLDPHKPARNESHK